METHIIKIKCPHCGAVLAVKKIAGIEWKNLTCPVCKENSAYGAFKPIVDKPQEDHTEYPNNKATYNSNDEPTILTDVNEHPNYTLGRLRAIASYIQPIRLKTGKNIIGRKAAASTANFQIPTNDSKRLSREHLVIEVKKIPGKGFVHFVSLYKLKCNATFVNNDRLEYGDRIVLQHGDILKLPDISFKFEIPDDEVTDL